jgi:GH25 family lysozyme M1 (1,4-beta-N-acetylmuramidase)
MQGLHRRSVPAVLALLVALALVPLTPQGVAADSDYAASCTARLRASPSTSATSIVTMPPGTVVTTTGTVQGDSWSAMCVTSVSGSTWYAITAVNGTSVSSLYGVGVAYAAAGLFAPSTAPPPTPAVYLEGIDVSHYQGTVDWTSVATAGKRFAILQATDGETCLDPMYATHHGSARAAGMLVTAYHFAEPSSSPGEAVLQADWYVNNAALLPGDLVPALDLERTGGLSAGELQAWVGAWLGEVYAKLGVRPMIYSSPNFWTTSMGDTTMFADQGYSVLWIAHWGTSSPTVPAANWGGHGWTFWQYTSTGSTAGISGRVDLDRYNGSDLSRVAFNYTYVPPPPLVPPNAPPVLAALTPNSAPAGGSDLGITIQGANFACAVSTAYWNGTPLATTYVSPAQLAAVVPAALTAMPGTSSVTVVNQTPGGGTSATAAFSVTGSTVGTPPPAITGITPTTAPAGRGDVTISIQGTGFAAGISTAYWNGIPLATTYVSPTQLAAIVPAALTATVGTGSVTVVNQPPGGGTSAPAAFGVTTPVPLPILDIGASSALGLGPTSGYSVTTPKTQAVGRYVTWRFTGGMALAGQRVNVMVAKRIGGVWGGPAYLKSAWADPNGSVTFWFASSTAAAINVRVQWPGSATYGLSTSTARGAYWK